MKKLLTVFALCGFLSVGLTHSGYAQNEGSESEDAEMEMADDTAEAMEEDTTAALEETSVAEEISEDVSEDMSAAVEAESSFTQAIKDTFIDEGPFFMSFVLIC